VAKNDHFNVSLTVGLALTSDAVVLNEL